MVACFDTVRFGCLYSSLLLLYTTTTFCVVNECMDIAVFVHLGVCHVTTHTLLGLIHSLGIRVFLCSSVVPSVTG